MLPGDTILTQLIITKTSLNVKDVHYQTIMKFFHLPGEFTYFFKQE
jgi:hypothetical protein